MRRMARGQLGQQSSSRARAAVLLALAIAVGCGSDSGVGSSASSGFSASPEVTANPWLAESEIARAIDFRKKAGLRSDPSWVRYVAQLPQAAAGVVAYGFPLTVAEIADFEERMAATGQALDVVNEYGASQPDDWAGATRDTGTGVVVARFTNHIAEYEAALRARVAPTTNLVVRQVRWSLIDLQRVMQRISDEWDGGASWLLEHQIFPLGVSIDIDANQVAFEVSSARLDLDALLEDHYQAVQMLAVVSDGSGVRLLPKGTLQGRVVDVDGNPVVGVQIELEPSIPGAGPHGDVGYATDAQGRFQIPDIEAVKYLVLVYTDEPLDTRTLLGSAPVTVVARTITNVQVAIP